MNVTSTGRPCRAASETGSPCWSREAEVGRTARARRPGHRGRVDRGERRRFRRRVAMRRVDDRGDDGEQEHGTPEDPAEAEEQVAACDRRVVRGHAPRIPARFSGRRLDGIADRVRPERGLWPPLRDGEARPRPRRRARPRTPRTQPCSRARWDSRSAPTVPARSEAVAAPPKPPPTVRVTVFMPVATPVCSGADVLDDQVGHRREREADPAAEERGGDVDLPPLAAGEGERRERREGEAGADEQQRLRAEAASRGGRSASPTISIATVVGTRNSPACVTDAPKP